MQHDAESNEIFDYIDKNLMHFGICFVYGNFFKFFNKIPQFFANPIDLVFLTEQTNFYHYTEVRKRMET